MSIWIGVVVVDVRSRSKLLKVDCTLTALTPIHVGIGGGDVAIDLVLVRDGQGNPVIPGTSLAGALRAWAEFAFRDNQILYEVFGYEESGSDSGAASRLVVSDGVLGTNNTQTQTHTAIDRWSGAAYAGTLHSREVIPRGSTITFTLELDSSSPDEQALVGHLLSALSEPGEIDLGAAKTRGLGEVQLTGCEIREEDWSSRDSVVEALIGSTNVIAVDNLTSRSSLKPKKRPRIDITIDWQPILPLMVSERGGVIDIGARTETEGGRVYLSLPGASIKGALRSRAEYIVRTIQGSSLGGPGPANRQWEQIDVDVVSELFGAVLDHGDKEEERAGHLGALRVSSIRSETSVDKDQWDELADITKEGLENKSKAPEANLREILDEINSPLNSAGGAQLDVVAHVAIDRFTGGAADSLLYTALEPHGFCWEPIRLRLYLDQLGGDCLPAVALLMAIIKELCDGWIPLGYGTNRGYGAIEVNAVSVSPEIKKISGREYRLGIEDGEYVDSTLVADGLGSLQVSRT